MSNGINKNSIKDYDINQLLSIHNSIKNLKKEDNASLFMLVENLDTDNNNFINASESIVFNILKLGEKKIQLIANSLGFNIKDNTTDNISSNDETEFLNEKSLNKLVKEIFRNNSLDINSKKDELIKLNILLSSKAKNLGATTKFSDQEFRTLINNLLNDTKSDKKTIKDFSQILSKYLYYIDSMEKMHSAITERLLFETKEIFVHDSDKLYLTKMAKLKSAGNDVLGDGTISDNNGALQETGCCWAIAGINALVATPMGQELVDNLVLKENGIIAVRLPEAAKKHLPKPKGDGIYTFTEKELAYSRISTGDSDVTAILHATSQFFSTINENSDKENNLNGGTAYRMFELLTGEHFKTYHNETILEGVAGTTFIEQRNPEILYENLKQLLAENKGGITTSFSGVYGDGSKDHAYAIVNIDEDFVYMRESNNPKEILKMSKEKFIKNSKGICTYKK